MDEPSELLSNIEQANPVAESIPARLEYESPRDRRERNSPTTDTKAFFFISGFIVAAAVTLVADEQVYEKCGGDFETAGLPEPHPITTGVYIFLTAATLVLLVRVFRATGWGAVLRWSVLGILAGVGLGFLLGGLWIGMS